MTKQPQKPTHPPSAAKPSAPPPLSLQVGQAEVKRALESLNSEPPTQFIVREALAQMQLIFVCESMEANGVEVVSAFPSLSGAVYIVLGRKRGEIDTLAIDECIGRR
jgi:hypothetical protein